MADFRSAAAKSRLACALSGVLIPSVGYLDYVTGYELSFSAFYLAPVFIAVWWVGMLWGMVAAVASALTWGIADVLSGHVYPNPAFYLWNSLIRLGFFTTVAYLLIALRKFHGRVVASARTDILTGLSNSRHFYELADVEVGRCQRHDRPVSLAYVDLDNFKLVNDRLGHAAGDDLLRLVAATLARQLRREDSLARLGGDEFAILLPETTPDAAEAVAKKIHANLGRTMSDSGYPVTSSIGVISCISPPESRDDLIRMADDLMYRVKKENKNAVVCAVHGKGQSGVSEQLDNKLA